ncbi:MAG: LytTR family transcriptional regulator DNA-binding domain-containing protein [Pontixanthobacter sp.]
MLLGSFLLFVAYWLIFALTTVDGMARAAWAAMFNTVPAIGLAIIAHLVLERHVWPARFLVRVASQIPFALVFAITWYVAILVIRELREGSLSQGLALRGFAPVAFIWQMFQGVTFYALAALASLSIVLGRQVRQMKDEADHPVSDGGNGAATTFLMRTTEGSEAIPVDDISTVTGAGDYTEVTLPGRKIMSTTTLAQFETRLPADRFIRAHRSHIVRLGAIERSEPAGNGKTVLHLRDGRTITTSRAGTKQLRDASL